MVDIQLDNDRELIIINGDFVSDVSDSQNVQLIFEAQKGEIRSSPGLGFGASKYLKKPDVTTREFLRNLKVELEKDGYNNVDISLNSDTKQLEVKLE